MSKTTKTVRNPATPSGHPLRATWHGMKARCNDPKATSYPYYGGRGITVSDEWNNDFWRFANDMGPRPAGHTLDRIDNDKGYSKDNCRWADKPTQMRNKRQRGSGSIKRTIFHEGESGTLKFWSDKTGIKSQTIAKRLDAHWPVAQALGFEPRRGGLIHMGKKTRGVIADSSGNLKTIGQWAAMYDVPVDQIAPRIRRGMSVEAAIKAAKDWVGREPVVITDVDGVRRPLTEVGKRAVCSMGVFRGRIRRGMSVERALTEPTGPWRKS